MNEYQKFETSRQIIQILESYNIVFEKLNNFIKEYVITNKENLAKEISTHTRNSEEHHLAQIKKVSSQVNLLLDAKKQNTKLIEQLKSESNVLEMAPQYLQLIYSEFSAEGNLNNFNSWIAQSEPLFDSKSKIKVDLEFNIRNAARSNVNAIIDQISSYNILSNYLIKFSQISTFEHVKDISHSVVIIGANGSGKSSFSRNTRKVLGGSIVIISAQKIFSYQQITSIPLGNAALTALHSFQSSDKLGKDYNSYHEHGQDLQNLIISLISEYSRCAQEFLAKSKDTQIDRPKPALERVMETWAELVCHRKMKYKEPSIIITDEHENDYEFQYLSDGEKAIFYYIAHILLAKENSYIIIDEPENHLHLSIVSKLWDALEKKRDDCKFIYLTHNIDFAASRIHAKKLWNKKFSPPASWEVEKIPQNQDIPEALLMELLGSRRKILFCEGTASSLDNKLYSILFPSYSIKPVGGHIDVINFTKAFNKEKSTFGNSAIGIIDGDYHHTDTISAWKNESIYCIDAQEVENLLCDEMLLEETAKIFHSDKECIDNAKAELFKELNRSKTKQSIEYATQIINNTLKSNLIKKAKTTEELTTGFEEAIASINIEFLINERINLLEEIIANKNFSLGIRKCNCKGIANLVGNKIVNDYKDRIFKLLNANQALTDAFREKFFTDIPVG